MAVITIPYETLKRMDSAIRTDQGNAYRANLKRVLPHIGDAYRSDEDAFRSHLGASIVGQSCARAIWYDFRWATKSAFSGQMLRLFNRGHIEEGRFIALLLTIGCEVYQQDAQGKQFRIHHADGHMGGSGDGVVVGLPDLPLGTAALGEFKTHNEKSFNTLAGDNWRNHLDYRFGFRTIKKDTQFDGVGVKEAKPDHYVQMQCYMRKMGLPVTLYVAVNKNTDDIYCELVTLDERFADEYFQRGENIVDLQMPPKKLSDSPGFWKCKFCDHAPVCHEGATPERNCRTCAFSSPVRGEPGGQWECRMHEVRIDKARQLQGCPNHAFKQGM
jgi:hypothetical protein